MKLLRNLSPVALFALVTACTSNNPVPGAPPPTAAARAACTKVRERDTRCEAGRRECDHVDIENTCLAQSPTVRDELYSAISRCFVDGNACGSDGAQRIDECINAALPMVTVTATGTAAAQTLCMRCPTFGGAADESDCVTRATGPSIYGTRPTLALFTDTAATELGRCIAAINPPADAGRNAVCEGVNDCYARAIGAGQTTSTCM